MKIALDARKMGDYGIGTYVSELVTAASAVEQDWTFVLLGGQLPPGLSKRANVQWVPCAGAGYGPGAIAALSAAARRSGADVVHCPHYVTPVGLDIPLVVTVHDCIHLRFPNQMPRALGVLPSSWSARYAGWLLQRAVHGADQVIAVSSSTRDDIRDLLGSSRSVTVIPNGVSAEWTSRGDGTRAAPPYIVWAGNPKPHKGLDVLLEAFAFVAERDAGVELVLAGSDLSDYLDGHPYAARIESTGYIGQSELMDVYRRATVATVPSRHEGFGLPALEAMAAGVPVVATAAGALPEVVGDAGLLVPPDDPERLGTALLRVVTESDTAARLASAGRARAAAFTWNRCARATCAVYAEAAR